MWVSMERSHINGSKHYLLTLIAGNKLTEDEVDFLIGEDDKDCDGTIDYEEFVKLMTSTH